MINNNKIFIGGKFLDSQLLFTLPIVDGYCKKKTLKLLFMKKICPLKLLITKIYLNF
jgi:hypothetical protein